MGHFRVVIQVRYWTLQGHNSGQVQNIAGAIIQVRYLKLQSHDSGQVVKTTQSHDTDQELDVAEPRFKQDLGQNTDMTQVKY
jgi:hypothetical protein